MLTLLLGTDWTANRDFVLKQISEDVSHKKAGRILIVPELISHDTERKLCTYAGDTSSRFAEVLTFTRLAKRVSDAYGFGVKECLDDGGRLVAMASASRQLHSKLKSYASVETQPEFLSGLVDAVDEFKRCCICPEDLLRASKKTDGSFAQKLEELALIYEAYNSLCARGKRDPRDQMTWLLEQMEDTTFASEHVFYIEGFPDFTKQHMEIIKHIIRYSPQVVISFTCDELNSEHPAFEKAGNTAGEIYRLACASGIETSIRNIPININMTREYIPLLFCGKNNLKLESNDHIRLFQTDSLYQECHAAAEQILDLIRKGNRFRDISVVCTDLNLYSNTLNMVFSRYNIPIYLSGTEPILDKTVITTVLSAIDAVVGGFEQSDVLRYLRSPMSPLDVSSCDRLENYVILWNISGKRWSGEWNYHPNGLGCEWTLEDKERINCLITDRDNALNPLFLFSKIFLQADTLEQQVNAIYHFLDMVQLDRRLSALADEMDTKGDLRNGQILGQLWEILLSALEQLSDMLGDTKWDSQTFTKLLRLLLSQYDVGTIPASLDAVTVGSVSSMRCQQPKHLIILGASEGLFPSYTGSFGVLTDQEREALRELGIPLTGGALEGLQIEFSEIHDVLCGAEFSICVSCSDGQPSFLYRRLREMVRDDVHYQPIGIASSNSTEAAGLLSRFNEELYANKMGILDIYKDLSDRKQRNLGKVDPNTVQKLYGNQLNLSASQVDKLADCRLAYFLKYGLRLRERKTASVDPAEFGTYVHAVLEETGKEIMQKGGFHNVSLEETLCIANHHSQKYINERFSQIESQRMEYLFRRNTQELEMVIEELWGELRESEFEPAAFELAFGSEGALDAIHITGQTMTAHLKGFVDRVDVWNQGEQSYYRVVDYKSGKKDFDYCDIYNGLGLQMLLYLFALEEDNCSLLGDSPKAAGVQYFPARVPIVSVEGHPDDEEAVLSRVKLWKRKGLLLADEAVLNAMEPSEKPKRLSYTRKKDGSIAGDLADRQQMKLLRSYIFALLGKMVDDIASGCVEPNPYTRGNRHNACAFCPYDAVCHSATVQGRRDYAVLSANEFWNNIDKEMSIRGRKTDL